MSLPAFQDPKDHLEQGKGHLLQICQVFKDPKQGKGFNLKIFKAFQDP